ncbi:hypothetical protein FQA39_LY17916 [Lamprigera yunnana]|nr:hypothetical protein FQA39_LY17916 [Lamprigera yunnana]
MIQYLLLAYIAEYENSLEIASVVQDDEHTTRHKEATTNNENVPPSDAMTWSRSNTLLLIENYKRLKEKFCNPKVKNKDVWADVILEFYKRGLAVTADRLDRKFRNLKTNI